MEDLVVESALDIDSCDSNNPLAVVDYVEDIYNYYKRVEVNFGPLCCHFTSMLITEVELFSQMTFV